MRLINFFVTVLLGIHLTSCFWFFVAKLEGFSPDTWVTKYGYIDKDAGSLYFISLYWAVTTLSTVGYGDIAASTELEMIYAIIWMLFGLFFFSFTIGSLTSMLSNIDTK